MQATVERMEAEREAKRVERERERAQREAERAEWEVLRAQRAAEVRSRTDTTFIGYGRFSPPLDERTTTSPPVLAVLRRG